MQKRYNPEELRKALGGIKERDVLRQVCQYLKARRCYFSRTNNVGVWNAKRQAYQKNWYQKAGWPDLVLLYKRKHIAIECKKLGGGWPPEQREFAFQWTDTGGSYWIVRSLDELIRQLKILEDSASNKP